jgi:hypothetical protein
MLTSRERLKLTEAYSDGDYTRTAVPNAVAGLLILFAIALAGPSYSDADAMRSTGVSATPAVTGR